MFVIGATAMSVVGAIPCAPPDDVSSATITNEISGAAFAVLPGRPGGWLSVAECVGYHCSSRASFFVLVGRPALIRTLRQTPAGWGLLRMSGPDRTSFP